MQTQRYEREKKRKAKEKKQNSEEKEQKDHEIHTLDFPGDPVCYLKKKKLHQSTFFFGHLRFQKMTWKDLLVGKFA